MDGPQEYLESNLAGLKLGYLRRVALNGYLLRGRKVSRGFVVGRVMAADHNPSMQYRSRASIHPHDHKIHAFEQSCQQPTRTLPISLGIDFVVLEGSAS